jgi:hypothetical protein
MIVIDDINGTRLRMPSLKISASFAKKTADSNKKKARMVELRDRTIRSQVDPTGKNNEL